MPRTSPPPSAEWSAQRVRQIAGWNFSRQLLIMLVLNLLIAVFLTTSNVGKGFVETLEVCNAIGFCIWGAFELLRLIFRERISVFALALVAIPAGFLLGSKIAGLFGTRDIISIVAHDPAHEWRMLAGSLMVAVFATAFFIFYWRAEAYRADLQSERRRAAEALQSETSAKLALLQAQIEPHFLFNTLANAQSVIESDPGTAKAILEHLNQYLRVSLGRTRRAASTLADEIGLVGALLAIARLRLGNRLRYFITVPDELKDARLPPLLLQPLVEPAVSGGVIQIDIRRQGDSLRMCVTDSGVGLNANSPEGVGLANVRGRLVSLYGDRGRLAIYQNEPHGVVAEITMPLQSV
jgi:signal transduction histidine kinase